MSNTDQTSFIKDVSKTLETIDDDDDGFGGAIIKLVRHGGKFQNFGTYYIPNLNSAMPMLTVWHGAISDYRYRLFFREMMDAPIVRQEVIEAIKIAPEHPKKIEYFKPDRQDIRFDFFKRTNISERLSITTRKGSSGMRTFFLRSTRDGNISEKEKRRIETILPIIHQLIQLRHRIIGSEAFHFSSGGKISELRARGLTMFSRLSPREAQACDLIIRGVTIDGSALEMKISRNSVITLRRRAYKKLGINSVSELSALLLNDQHFRE